MTQMRYEQRTTAPSLVFSIEDAYARERGFRGRHPGPIGDVRFTAVARMVAGQREALSQPAPLVMRRNASGYYLFYGETRLPDRSTRRGMLDDGRYVVRVESEYYQTAEPEVDLPVVLPLGAKTVDLEPGYAYPFPPSETAREPAAGCGAVPRGHGPTLLRGGLYQTDGSGLAGATVRVSNLSNTYKTDETGQWVLWFADTQQSGLRSVSIRLPGAAADTDVDGVCIAQGCDMSLAQAALRGWVHNAAGIGIAGARILVNGLAAESRSRADGSWSYYFDLNQPPALVDVTAVLPDGSTSPPQSSPVKPRATVVVPTIRFV